MLSKENRLKKKNDFEAVFKAGKGFKGSFFSVIFKKNDFRESRFGFVVSKKISLKAVVRNKIRRRLSEAVRLNISKIISGCDVVLIAFPEIKNKNYKEIEENLLKVFNKIKK